MTPPNKMVFLYKHIQGVSHDTTVYLYIQ